MELKKGGHHGPTPVDSWNVLKRAAYAALGALLLALALRFEGGRPAGVGPLPPGELVSFMVHGASRPGARCRVKLAGTRVFWVSLPAEPCQWSRGDRIELPREVVQRWNRRGRASVLWVNHFIGHRRGTQGFWAALAKWRRQLFLRCAGEPGANFVLASLSGIPTVLRWTRLQWLREAGLGHLTAVSGLHVGTLAQVVFWGVRRLTGLCQRPRWSWSRVDLGALMALVACLIPLIAFVMATGAAASACRALLCWGVFALMACFGVNLHRLVTLGWIGGGMLVVHPAWLRSPGFYFSFVATAILLWPKGVDRSELVSDPPPGRGWQALLAQSSWSTSWRLCWALAPLSLWFFQKASTVSVLANLVAIPVFAGWVLPFGLLAVGTAALSELVGCAEAAQELVVQLMFLAGWGGTVILDTAQLFSRVSYGGPWHWALMSTWALVVYPKQDGLSPLHPLAGAPRTLLWVLVCAPLWVF